MKIFRRLPGRRKRYGLAVTAAAAMTGSVLIAVPAFSDQTPAFDLDHGNALVQIIFPRFHTVTPFNWTNARTEFVHFSLHVIERKRLRRKIVSEFRIRG